VIELAKGKTSQTLKAALLFKNPNKFLIYSQELINEELDFKNTSMLNYNYSVPILFCKHYFYDLEMINNKHIFIKLLESFENIINNTNVINIKNNNNIIEKYYIDHSKLKIFKLTNINYFSQFHIYNNNLYINNVINGYDEYIKNENNIYEKTV